MPNQHFLGRHKPYRHALFKVFFLWKTIPACCRANMDHSVCTCTIIAAWFSTQNASKTVCVGSFSTPQLPSWIWGGDRPPGRTWDTKGMEGKDSGGATPGRARSNDLAGRSTALAPPCLLLCFASVIVWTENKNFTIFDRWPLYLFYFDSKTISAVLVAFVFWGRRLKKIVNFLRKKGHPCNLARECSDLEMTWLLYCAGAVTGKRDGGQSCDEEMT